MSDTILVGDVGGTNTRFGCAKMMDSQLVIEDFFKTPNDDHKDFGSALNAYLSQSTHTPSHACFAIAGPIADNAVKLTNRNWDISGADLEKEFGFTDVKLINDFAAMARAVPELSDHQFHKLIPGTPIATAPIIVAGPGTGFGVATLMTSSQSGWRVLQGEGGHIAYAPQTGLEFQIAQILMREHGYVSNELIASGSGLPAVHQAFCKVYDCAYKDMHPADMLALAEDGDEMFIALCKLRARTVLRAAGDLVLANGARGGVVLAGGVTERLIPYLSAKDVKPSFASRGPLSHYLDACPVDILTEPTAPLIGAAAMHRQ